MSQWYPIAFMVEETRASLADLALYFASRVTQDRASYFNSLIEHCFGRLQLWATSFDVDSHALDQKLRQAVSLSGMVIDVLEKLKSVLKKIEKAIPRYGSVGDGDLGVAKLYIAQATNIIDMLFELSPALETPSFTSLQQEIGTTPEDRISVIENPVASSHPHTTTQPSSNWRTAVILNDTKTAKGTRWGEVGAVLTHIYEIIKQKSIIISFVRFTSDWETTRGHLGISGAIERIRTQKPSDELLNGVTFKGILSEAVTEIRSTGSPHSSVLWVVPDGFLPRDAESICRAILQTCKEIRGTRLAASSIIISFVLTEPNPYLLSPLLSVANLINEDRAVIGTVIVRVLPYYILSASQETYESIILGGPAELDKIRRDALEQIYVNNEEITDASNSGGGECHVLVTPISVYTDVTTIYLEFGRFGTVDLVTYQDSDHATDSRSTTGTASGSRSDWPTGGQRTQHDISPSPNQRDRAFMEMASGRVNPQRRQRVEDSQRFMRSLHPPIEDQDSWSDETDQQSSVTRRITAVVDFARDKDAEAACVQMDGTRFDGNIINVKKVPRDRQREEIAISEDTRVAATLT